MKHSRFFWMGTGSIVFGVGVFCFFSFFLSQNNSKHRILKEEKLSKKQISSFVTIPAKNEFLLQQNEQTSHSHSEAGHSCGNGPRFYSDVDLEKAKASLVPKSIIYHAGTEAIAQEVLVQWNGPRQLEAETGLTFLSWNETLQIARYTCSNIEETMAHFQARGIHAEPNFIARTALVPEDTRYLLDQQKTFNSLGLETAWETHQGSPSVTIAVLDTGVDPHHEDLLANLLPGIDFTDCPIQNRDLTGHGTAMAGIIGARGNNQKGIAGVVWYCRILPVRVADHQGLATYEQLANGIQYAADQGAKIINLSLGATAYSKILHQAVKYASDKGCLLIGAAGNDKANSPVYPACFEEVMCVVATNGENRLTLNTNVPKEAEIAAPGKDIFATWPLNLYAQVSGTSCATAFVSGEAALLWSIKPECTAEQIRALITHNTSKIPIIEQLSSFFYFGQIDIQKAVEALQATTPLLEVRRVSTFPKYPVAKQPLELTPLLVNRTLLPVSTKEVQVKIQGQTLSNTISMGPLEKKEIQIQSTTPVQESLLSVYLQGAEEDAHLQAIDPISEKNAQLQWLQIHLNLRGKKFQFQVDIENQGLSPSASTTWTAYLNQQSFQQGRLSSLEPKQKHRLVLNGDIAQLATGALQVLRLECQALEKPLYYVFKIGQAQNEMVKTLYQQGGGVDLIVDMPYRLRPSGAYLPLLIFLPDNGGNGEMDYLAIDSCRIALKSTPEEEVDGVLVYDDSFEADPSLVASGIELLNEEGEIQIKAGMPDYNLFEDEPQFFRGRSAIFRLPRTLFPTEESAETPVSYAKVNIDWSFYRILMTGFEKVDEGFHAQTLQAQFPTSEWPELPGINFYYDTHVHTVAEWTFTEEVNLFAPEKAYGGPIQMIKESAYAIGLTDSVDEVKGRVITTDHNCFFNDGQETDAEDSPNHRPTWGPTSPSSSLAEDGSLKSEWTRMKEIFGEGAGEEISFNQKQFALVPMGAHLLSYQGEHFDGTWHGGSEFSELLGEGSPLELKDVLKSLATIKEDGTNAKAFTYAAHPYSSQGWEGENVDRALGLNLEASDYINSAENFIFKGFQVFNGRGERSLPSSDIYFEELNPFINPTWKAGNSYWDRDLQKGLVQWQINLARLMPYKHPTLPGVVLVRKTYISAGSDAHGDFNYTTTRLAKLLDLQSTFSVDASAFGRARSYVFTEGVAGTSPEEKGLNALAYGNSIATDGLLLHFEMDSDGKWNSETQTYHDTTSSFENKDGRMGGGGKFDGERSMLVLSDGKETQIKYRYATTPEFGDKVETIHIYKATETRGNRFRLRPVAGTSGISTDFIPQLTASGTLSAGASFGEGTKKLSESGVGEISEISCLSLGGFTHGDPDSGELPAEASRAYTNPIWIVPVEMKIDLVKVNPEKRSVAPGDLKVSFVFPISMSSEGLSVKIKQIGTSGTTDSGSAGVLSTLVSEGWDTGTLIKNSSILFTNATTITASETPYPISGSYSFVAYLSEKPKDYFGNELNTICKKFTISTPAGCFLATAALSQPDGLYKVSNKLDTYRLRVEDFEQLQTLRNFRDQTLNQSSLGRTFVQQYYYFAPQLSQKVGSHSFYKNMVKGLLLKPLAFLLQLFFSPFLMLGLAIFLGKYSFVAKKRKIG